ncbi:MAG: sialate O-acetylesterase [Lentisphaeraceae bacterium]|nr:sialate O-acetylesterase [Lentisphaeraceae bacterium]
MSVSKILLSLCVLGLNLVADVKLPSIFSDNMVLQQQLDNKVWGWAEAGEEVTVKFAGNEYKAKADDKGDWSLKLKAMKYGGPYELVVSGKNTISYKDVLVGEVWVCSGQSNMGWTVNNSVDQDLEKLMAKYPNIRLLKIPLVGTQEVQKDFKGSWMKCTPETVGNFTAVGYFFGRNLHKATDIPIGLINDSWGGSSCEAWINRDLLNADAKYKELMDRWKKTESNWNEKDAKAKYEKDIAAWKDKAAKAKEAGKPAPRKPRYRNPLTGQHRPANLYNGMIKPIIGYGIRGAIWYQGESNAGRAYQYRELFPLMIDSWRDEWGIGNFPFYWVQLADYMNENQNPESSAWAELREAQTMTMDKLENTGEAVIIDIGEGKDIHPKNKQDVGARLARWALAKQYGVKIPYQSPRYKSMTVDGNKIVLEIDHVISSLNTFDVRDLRGFTIAGADKKFVNAQAKFSGKNKIIVWADSVKEPASVRYAWANNPICNIYSKEGLPLTPFRTDDWPGVTINNK